MLRWYPGLQIDVAEQPTAPLVHTPPAIDAGSANQEIENRSSEPFSSLLDRFDKPVAPRKSRASPQLGCLVWDSNIDCPFLGGRIAVRRPLEPPSEISGLRASDAAVPKMH